MEAGNSVQVIFGTEAESIKDNIKAIIANGGYINEEDEPIENLDLDNKKPVQDKEISESVKLTLLNPIKGEIVKLEDVPDEVFSSKALGDGFAIKPEGNKVYAPIDGEIAVLFPTKHAIAIKGDDGLEFLVHVGIDTVNLNGEGFNAHVNQGDKVKKGDLLLSFDMEIVNNKAKSSISPMVITNMDIVSSLDVSLGNKSEKETVATLVTK